MGISSLSTRKQFGRIALVPSKFFLALHSFCCRLSVILLSYDSRSTIIPVQLDRRKKIWSSLSVCLLSYNSRSTLIRLDGRKKIGRELPARPNFFLRSSRIRADLISYEGIPTDKREQYDWRAEKNLDGRIWMKKSYLISNFAFRF